jgi:hypothetical protein
MSETVLPKHKRNIEGLRGHAIVKSETSAKRADDAIKRLLKQGARVNFNSVSQEGAISKAYLYKNPELRSRIEAIRKQQEGLSSPRQVKKEMTDASKDVIIAAKNKKIREQEAELKRLKEELLHLRGKIYDAQ